MVLQHRAVDLLGRRVDESGIALEFGKPEGRPEALDHRIHQIGDDVLRMVEFDPGEKVRIAGDIGDGEISRFRFRKHCNLQRRCSPAYTRGMWCDPCSGHARF